MARPRSQGASSKLTPLEDGPKAPRRTARLEGTLVVSAPGGPCELRTLFDTGSEADAVSYEKALELRQHGVGWGESGGNMIVARGLCARDWPEIGRGRDCL